MGASPQRAFPAVVDDVRAALAGGTAARVVVVLLDAFGWRFVERHADHPLLRRIAAHGTLEPLRSQFPSTTTAHVTTMHTGVPVGTHGLYEWRIWEPSLGRIVRPLPDRDLDHAALLPPGPLLYEQLDAASCVFNPASFSPSPYDRATTRGADLRPYGDLRGGLDDVVAQLGQHERCYAHLYWDRIDAAGHAHGPSSAAFDAEIVDALDALEEVLVPGAPDGTLLLLTADHGQVDVAAERFDELDVLWPALPGLLTAPPAGSSRDVFLHVASEHVDEVVAGLGAAVGERGTVHATADLIAAGWFGEAGPRLLERVGDVCVLPAAGRLAWLRGVDGGHPEFRGHHGGVDPAEATTFVGRLALG